MLRGIYTMRVFGSGARPSEGIDGRTEPCDASGDMTSDGTYTYAWDARNRLQSAQAPGWKTMERAVASEGWSGLVVIRMLLYREEFPRIGKDQKR